MDGIYLRRVERRAVPLPLEQKIFDAEWTESPIAAVPAPEPAAETTRGSWLVLADATVDAPGKAQAKSMADDFVQQWRSPMRRVHTADIHDESAVLAAFAETAGDPEHPPVGVVVFVGGASSRLDDELAAARDTVWSITTVVRAVVGTWHGRSPRLWLVTGGGLSVADDEPGTPAAASLKGLVRVLAFEHPDMRTTLVDLDITQDPLTALSAELRNAGSGSRHDDVIAWRGERRFVERLSRATIDVSKGHPVVRQGASYVVTGGLGGLGLVVARWLVDRGAGRVVLGGRSDPTDEQCNVLAELQTRAEIVVVRGDVASPGVAEKLIETARQSGGQLRGVVHAARSSKTAWCSL